jgi:hypothetical protein
MRNLSRQGCGCLLALALTFPVAGLARADDTFAPNMIGDSFGYPAISSTLNIGSLMTWGPLFGSTPGPTQTTRYVAYAYVPYASTFQIGNKAGTIYSTWQSTSLIVITTDIQSNIYTTLINEGKVQILDNQVPHDKVDSQFSALLGPGTTVFDPTSSYLQRSPGPHNFDYTAVYAYDYYANAIVANPGAGGGVGRVKIADDTSPMPRDRIIFDYGFFENVPLAPGGVTVHRFTPGFEKTFFDGLMSLELKAPVAVTIDSTVIEGGGADLSHGEFGNLAVTWKALLLQSDHFALSGGLMVTVPTARDTIVNSFDGTQMLAVRNRSTHVGPFFGFLWTPNEKFFAQGFYQVDVETSGCPVLANLDVTGLQNVGLLHDATYQYIDLGIGSWIYRGHGHFQNLTGLAWTLELHGSDSFKSNNAVAVDYLQIGDYASLDAWNLTVGSHVEIRNDTTLTFAYCTPVCGHDREFSGELRLMFNRYFGASSRVLQTPDL